MNEQLIAELEKRAWEYVDATWDWANPDNPNKATIFKAKFAELIVRECGNYMNSRVPGNLEVSATVAKMRQHFGGSQ